MSTERLNEAAEWWLRLREPNVPPETVAEWMRWCDAHPENSQAFEGVQALWQKAGLAPLRPASPEELERERPRRPALGLSRGLASKPAHRLAPERRHKPARIGAIAAGLAAVIASGGVYWLKGSHAEPAVPVLAGQGDQAMSPPGQRRIVKLPDGSRVILGGASRLSTAFTPSLRGVRLESGEAYFEVHKDARRPFVVETLGAAITAVGTAFNVRADAGTLRVTVTEGAVDVRSTLPAAVQGAAVRLSAGRQVVLKGGGVSPDEPPHVSTVDPGVAMAWTNGTLKFMDEPLGSVVAAVNRYSPGNIELEGEELAGLRYTGTVVSGRIDEWLAALPNAFPVEVVQQGSGRARIRPRER